MTRLMQVILVIFVSLSLPACGGGDFGDSTGGDTGGGTNPPPTGNGNATVSWSIPATRQSGTALTMSELGGYKIYYGVTSTNLNTSVDVSDPYQTSQQMTNLTTGTVYYFQVTAYDTAGAESQRSNLITRTAS